MYLTVAKYIESTPSRDALQTDTKRQIFKLTEVGNNKIHKLINNSMIKTIIFYC